MDEATVRQRIVAARAAGFGVRRRGFPPDVRQVVTDHVERRVRQGAPRSAVARDLGISVTTLDNWKRRSTEVRAMVPAFRRVEVVEAAYDCSPLVVQGPCGIRVEGLSVDQLADLIRRLA